MNRRTLRARLAGMTLVELMVAMAIGLIGIVVIFQVFAVNEGVRRSTTSGSDEQTSGILGLTLIERELRHAGFGINDFDLIGCQLKVYDNMRTPAEEEFPLSPVTITFNDNAEPDLITVIYGGVSQTTAPVALTSDMADEKSRFELIYRFGFAKNDVLLVGQPGSDCVLRQVTGLPPDASEAYLLHDPGARFNKPEGTPVPYQALGGGRVVNLGPFPARIQLTVVNDSLNPSENNQLVQVNAWGEIADLIPMAEQIVQLKAQYGLDDGGDNGSVLRDVYKADDNIVDRYVREVPADWKQVLSVRVALVSRSNAPERPTTGTDCDATPDFSAALDDDTYPVRWARGPDAPLGQPIDVRTTGDWRCYKYKVYETVVPLRNMLWRQA
jgi:type IV pilus assembly protein PilW